MTLYNQRTSLNGIFLALLYFVLSVCGFVVNYAVPSSNPQVSFATIRPSTSTTFLSMATNDDIIPSRQFIFEGMEAFRQGDVVKSIEKFDASVPCHEPTFWTLALPCTALQPMQSMNKEQDRS